MDCGAGQVEAMHALSRIWRDSTDWFAKSERPMFALWLRARKFQSKLPRESRATRFMRKLPPAAVVARFFSGITPMIWSKLFSLIFFAAQAQLACRH
jgi:hypothetical protein